MSFQTCLIIKLRINLFTNYRTIYKARYQAEDKPVHELSLIVYKARGEGFSLNKLCHLMYCLIYPYFFEKNYIILTTDLTAITPYLLN